MFFWNSLAFCMIQPMLAIWSQVPLPFLNPACTSGSSQLTYSWSLAWRILSISLWACEMSATVQQFEHSLAYCLSLGLEWKLTFSSPMATAEFSKFAGILSAEQFLRMIISLSWQLLYSWPLNNEGIGGPTLLAMENLPITYSWPFMSVVPFEPAVVH